MDKLDTRADRSSAILSNRYLRLLNDPRYRGIVDMQDLVSYETARFWRDRGVKSLHLPITTGSISSPMGLGSDSEPVMVNLFGEPTYLADSMQFMLEYGCRLADAGAYYLMPSFRGEDPDEFHLNQFFHSEVEIPGGLEEVMDVADAYVRHLSSCALEQYREVIVQLAGSAEHVERLLDTATSRISFEAAEEALDGVDGAIIHHQGWRTITRNGERELIRRYGPAVWLTNFDKMATPFYQARSADGRSALCADYLLGRGEILGCGERHPDGVGVREALREHRVSEDDYHWYAELKDVTPMRTSGFGMGVERYIMWLLGGEDIREFQLVDRQKGAVALP